MKKIDTFSHYREGKSQMQRFLAELDPGNLELHDFDLFDWLLFANNFAKRVNFFDKDDLTGPAQNWEKLFLGADDYPIPRRESTAYKELKKQVTDLIAEFEQDGSLTPHLTLFVCFIKLLDFSRKDFNNLAKKHLDLYYQEILQIQKQDAKADKAYIIFELAKKAVQERIPEGTVLDAKKDGNGKKMVFRTDDEFVANQAKVVQIKSFLNDSEKRELKMARKADSLDGLGEKLPDDAHYWWPFGYNSDEANYPQLENAKLGFAIASSLFELKEGERNVNIKIYFSDGFTKLYDKLSKEKIVSSLTVLCSGEKDWLFVEKVECTPNKENNLLELSFTLQKDFPAVVKYNRDVLSEIFNTEMPVIRFVIAGYDLYEALLEKVVKDVLIDVDVKGIKSVKIENDSSTLNADKPYYPFTTQPVKGSNFYVRYPEMFSKKWDSADITINWKNTPASITDLYQGYILEPDESITKDAFNKAANGSFVKSDDHFKVDLALLEKEEWTTMQSGKELFKKSGDKYFTQFSVENNTTSHTSEAIRVTLKQSALQDVYPKLYTLALMSVGDPKNPQLDKLIPNEPYIPFAEDIELSYTAKENAYSYLATADKKITVEKNSAVQLFHEDAFGQYEKSVETASIVPEHEPGGEMFVGLDATPGDTVSLLIKMSEGSENPLPTTTFASGEKIEWSVLCNNTWKDLSEYILVNETKRFLESGIVKLVISPEANIYNTLLPAGLIWLRATTVTPYDAVCKIEGIYTQAAVATFENHDNELSHLSTGLAAGTIDKLITRVPQIKSVSQPYNSFGGAYQETDVDYYRRVSERLRSKNRGITLWDYEHLILQQFPEVFKVKCLAHTSDKSYMAPGYVTLMVVPDTKNKNAFDIYQPRVSRATLDKIQDYVNSLNTMHVTAKVINPNYQEAEIHTSVKFYSKYDEVFYKKQLDLDIKKYISPWAFAENKDMAFGVKLNVNQIVNYLEQLYYVDYIDDLKIYVNDVLQTKYLIEVDPKSILVSAKSHEVAIAQETCSKNPTDKNI